MRPGDEIECALWFDPAHPSERDSAKGGIRRAILAEAESRGLAVSSIVWNTVEASDRRLPPPPAAMKSGVKCLIGRARVLALLHKPRPRRFCDDLDAKDLARFRAITRREHTRAFPADPPLSDIECDDWIERYGPDAAATVVRNAFDAGTLH